MLFYPREEKNFYIFKLQGIFPKRQEEMARRQAKLVSRELFNTEDIKDQIMGEEMTERIHEVIEEEVGGYLRDQLDRLPGLVTAFIPDSSIEKVKKTVTDEAYQFVPSITSKFFDGIDEVVDVEQLVYEKVRNYSSEKLEKMLMSVLKDELRYIEMAGGVLGFMVGIVQVFLIIITS
jgi:uncharacterized membrane protein YheB (UPF0754 family)